MSIGSLLRSLEQNQLTYLLDEHPKLEDTKSLASLHDAVANVHIRVPHDNGRHFNHTYKKSSAAVSYGNYASSADERDGKF